MIVACSTGLVLLLKNDEKYLCRPLWTRAHTEFTNFMNKHCSEWSSSDRIYQSRISTVCGQYGAAFLMFRCRNVSMHAFSRLFTTDLVANDCRVFDWLGAEYAL